MGAREGRNDAATEAPSAQKSSACQQTPVWKERGGDSESLLSSVIEVNTAGEFSIGPVVIRPLQLFIWD